MPRTVPPAFQLLLLPLILLNAACSQITRGSEINSADGKTYLVVAELDGPACTTVYLDGKPWPHAVGVAGAIEPGEHEIKCAAPIHFIVRPGTVFRFKYWGP